MCIIPDIASPFSREPAIDNTYLPRVVKLTGTTGLPFYKAEDGN